MIKTVIFDLGKVIVDFTLDEAYRRMQEASGLPRDEIQSRLIANGLPRDYETGRINSIEFVAEVNRRMGTAIPMAEFAELWSSIFHLDPLIPESLLEQIRQRHRLLLLSNTNPLHFAMIRENFQHIEHFHGLVLSHEVGALKPEAPIYEAAIQLANCEPGECLFFDDLAENVEGARRSGLNAEQFLSHQQVLIDLARYGVHL